MRAVFVLHLFYDDIAIELIDALARLRRRIDAVVTTPRPLAPAVRRLLERLGGRVEIVRTKNAGRDVGPFLEVLPLLAARGYEVFCKLHTKRGLSGYGDEWREALYEPLIGSTGQVGRILAAFAGDKRLAIVGARQLFLSVARHLPPNRQAVLRLGRLAFPLEDVPGDWGFFAGTMFWGRTASFGPFARLGDYGIEPEPDNAAVDGQVAHALERVFGLVGVAGDGRFGCVGEAAAPAEPIVIGDASSSPPADTLQQRLMAIKQKRAARPYPRKLIRRLVASHNPLVHYLENPAGSRFDPNPFLHDRWYVASHKDVAANNANPVVHYMREGAPGGVNPSPIFNTGFYYQQHPNLLRAGTNPLSHFLRSGEAGGDRPAPPPLSDVDIAWSRAERLATAHDAALERAFWDRVCGLPDGVGASAEATLVSVVTPVLDDGSGSLDTIRSALRQTHRNLELIVVTAGQPTRLAAVRSDRRVKFVEARTSSLAGLRNLGLAAATGQLVAFLDPGNRWRPRFLEAMTFLVKSRGLACATAIAEFRNGDSVLGFMGEQFDRALCLESTTIALDAFCCARTMCLERGGFDEGSPHPAWDLILRYTRDTRVGFAPVLGASILGVNALEAFAQRPRRNALASVTRDRNLTAGARASDDPKLALALKIAAPEREHHRWGDFHFAVALKDAFERLGHRVRIDLRDRWYSPLTAPDDVVVVLRGPKPYQPDPAHVNVLWNISQPEDVSYDEMEAYDLVYVASDSYARFLRSVVDGEVRELLQATDPNRFHPVAAPGEVRSGLLFVGNTRSQYRPIVRWAIEEGLRPRIYGAGWQNFAPANLIEGDYLDNRSLAPFYAGADAVLNDHLASMRDFGFVSNRVFDVLASGGRLVSDHVPSMARLFGTAVATVGDRADLANALRSLKQKRGDRMRRKALARQVAREHSFDERARVVSRDLASLLGPAIPVAKVEPASRRDRDRQKVLVLSPHGAAKPDDHALARLISPLTSESAGDIDLIVGDEKDLNGCAKSDVCIVQAHAGSDLARLGRIADRVQRVAGARLIVDVPATLDALQPGIAPAALSRLLRRADQCWLELDDGSRGQGDRHVVSTGIDARIWKDYSSAPRPILEEGRLRILWVDRSRHPGSDGILVPALDRLWAALPGCFEVTAVRLESAVPSRPWLRQLIAPAAASYPRFARWLRQQGPFDAGVSAIPGPGEDAGASDIGFLEYAALGLLPVLSKGRTHRAAEANGAAVIVGNGVDAWFEAVAGIATSRRDYVVTAEAAREYVWETRTADIVGKQMVGLIARIAGRSRSPPNPVGSAATARIANTTGRVPRRHRRRHRLPL